jgi:Flp pilus assembly protein TadG
VVEFAMVIVVLIALLMGVIQLALYLHVRNVLAASAAEGARYAANANADPSAGVDVTRRLVGAGLGTRVSDSLRCTGTPGVGARGEQQVVIHCTADVPLVFGWLGSMNGPQVTARSIKEN